MAAVPGTSRRIKRTLIAFGVVAALIIAGAILNALLGPRALDLLESWTSRFAQVMRFIRPAVLILILAFWQILIGLAIRMKILPRQFAALATKYWLHLALWAAVIEITIGQGWIIPGLAIAAVVYAASRLNLIPAISVTTEENDK